MRLASLLTKRNIIGALVVGAVVLGTGFGYIIPAFSDTGSMPESEPSPDDSGPSGGNGVGDSPSEPDETSESSGDTNTENRDDSRQTAAPPESTAKPTTGETQGKDDLDRSSNGRVDGDTAGDDNRDDSDATPGLVVTGETNAAAN